MANVYATKSGLWSDTAVWNTGALPATVDNVYTNTFTVTADTNTTVATIRNSSASGILSGGSFWLANGVSLSCTSAISNQILAMPLITILPNATAEISSPGFTYTTRTATDNRALITAPGPCALTIRGDLYHALNTSTDISPILSATNSAVVNVVGNITSGGGTTGVVRNVSSTLNIIGIVTGGTSGGSASHPTINNIGTGVVNLTGAAYAVRLNASVANTNSCWSIQNDNNGTINVVGDVYATRSSNGTLTNSSNGIININGNLYGNSISYAEGGACISNSTTGTVNITGDLIATNGARCIVSSVSPNVNIYTNSIINAPNGRQAIYAPRYQVFPTGSAQYTRQASNGYDSYVDYWTSNSTFSYPASSDVALGTTYSNSTLTGSMAVPSPSSVALGAPVGTTTGTASITFDNVLSQPIANLTTPNSIGARLKNITTSQALSAIVNSLEF